MIHLLSQLRRDKAEKTDSPDLGEPQVNIRHTWESNPPMPSLPGTAQPMLPLVRPHKPTSVASLVVELMKRLSIMGWIPD